MKRLAHFAAVYLFNLGIFAACIASGAFVALIIWLVMAGAA